MQLYPVSAKHPDLDSLVAETFSDLQLDLIACEACGDYHPPEIHLSSITPFDPSEPEEA